MGSHFAQNQKIVTYGFPWFLGTEPKICYPWDLEGLDLVFCKIPLQLWAGLGNYFFVVESYFKG